MSTYTKNSGDIAMAKSQSKSSKKPAAKAKAATKKPAAKARAASK